ncbi:L,D-transpeptidase [Candidatus Roizmanbacteria bacterium]|nr:L,D-transpeptidase [Candidatus Roizmanbacteria bacterium]
MKRRYVWYVIGLIVFIAYAYINTHTFPNTYIGDQNVSWKSTSELKKIFNKLLSQSVKVKIKDRSYSYRYAHLGVEFNTDMSIQALFPQERTHFPLNVINFGKSFFTKTSVIPTLTFSQDFYQFTQYTVYDFSNAKDRIIVNQQTSSLSYDEREEKYKVDRDNLKTKLVFTMGKRDVTIEPELQKYSYAIKDQVSTVNEKLAKVFGNSIYFLIKDGEKTFPITITPGELKQLISTTYIPQENRLVFSVSSNSFLQFINAKGGALSNNLDKKIPLQVVKNDLISLLNLRTLGLDSDTVVSHIDALPNTIGDKGKKYIEVDISQQKMFLFEKGELVRSYPISTGLEYPTPPGNYTILNKAENAYSDIYQVWMPYWMAFYYDPKVNAYLGIHELPYRVNEEGKRLQSPNSAIGKPLTGGCVALDLHSSKEVYDFSDIGMGVYIFE